MKRNLTALACLLAFVMAPGAFVRAQEKQEKTEIVTLKLQVVVSRWQGEKKTSSMPFTLSVNASNTSFGRANLRMGAKIPIVMMMAPPAPGPDGKDMQVGPIQYQDVGTNIDCTTRAYDGGRYGIDLTIEDSSVYEEQGKRNERPSFRSFRASDSMILKDGQSAQFTAATDKVNGEVTKVDVTLTVVK